jgi:hypothetical protein
MIHEDIADLDSSNVTPLEQIHIKEFVEGALKAGSFISMLENKKINTTTLFSLLLEKEQYQDFFTEITASKNFKSAILSLLYLHPSLVKSKITKSLIRKLKPKQKQQTSVVNQQTINTKVTVASNINAKPINRTRKTSLQQTSSDLEKFKE